VTIATSEVTILWWGQNIIIIIIIIISIMGSVRCSKWTIGLSLCSLLKTGNESWCLPWHSTDFTFVL